MFNPIGMSNDVITFRGGDSVLKKTSIPIAIAPISKVIILPLLVIRRKELLLNCFLITLEKAMCCFYGPNL